MYDPNLPLAKAGGSLSPDDLAKLRSSKLSDEVIKRNHYRHLADDEAKGYFGLFKGDCSGLLIPYPVLIRNDHGELDFAGDELFHRLRRMNIPTGIKGDAKYVQRQQTASRLYFSWGLRPQILTDTKTPIIITEGELKTACLQDVVRGSTFSYPSQLVIGISGVWNWRGASTSGRDAQGNIVNYSDIIPDLRELLAPHLKERKVTLLFDRDVEQNRSVNAARRRLAKWLEEQGANVFYFEWPDLHPECKGIDDLAHVVGVEAVRFLLASNVQPAKKSEAKVTLTDEPPEGFELLFKDEPTHAEYYKAKQGDHWRIFQKMIDDKKVRYEVLCGLIDKVHKVVAADGSERSRLVCWKDENNRDCEAVVPMADLLSRDAAGLVSLANHGLFIYPGRLAAVAKLITCFPSSSRVHTASKPGWTQLPDGAYSYVLPDESFGVPGVRLQIAGEHYYHQRGTLDDWRREIGARCVGNTRLTLAVSAAFAGPLLHGLGVAGVGIHLVCPTSSGKTSILSAAGSVFGGGGVNGAVRAWNATTNSMEVLAVNSNDNVVVFDELGGSSAKDVVRSVYSLINGIGRTRLDVNSNLRQSRTWRIVLLSGGELDVHEFARLAGQESKGGVDVRLLAIPLPADSKYRLFETIHDSSSGAAFADALHTAAVAKCYGTAGREFMRYLLMPEPENDSVSSPIGNLHTRLQRVRHFVAEFEESVLPKNAPAEVLRAGKSFAVVAAAGRLASHWGITGWPREWSFEAVATCFRDWVADRNEVAGDDTGIDAARGIRLLVQKLTQFDSRFKQLKADADGFEAPTPYEMYGWQDADCFYVNTSVYENILLNGYSRKAVSAELKRRDLLVTTDKNDSVTKNLDRHKRRVVQIKKTVLEVGA